MFTIDIYLKGILCWSDSQISLAWVKDIDLEFKAFLQNRLIAIRYNVHPHNWRYWRTNENPADITTKVKICNILTIYGGRDLISWKTLLNIIIEKESKWKKNWWFPFKQTWWKDYWFKDFLFQNIIDIKNFSTLKKIIIITSKIDDKKSNLINYLTSGWINNSKTLRLQIIQGELMNSDKFKNFKYSLWLKEDEIGIYQCIARIYQNSSISYETRNPITFNGNHVSTKLIVEDCNHTKNPNLFFWMRILSPCWFSLYNSETLKAVTLAFCSIQ